MELPTRKIKILVVEDDINLGYLLKESLQDKGFEATIATNGKSAISAVHQGCFELCLLDIMLPEEDGFAVAAHLRNTCPDTPFIFLSAKSHEKDKLFGFELGAEDYITKPFSFKELLFRMTVILRRQNKQQRQEPKQEILSFGYTVLDPIQRTLEIKGKTSKISNRENELLSLLLQNKGNYVSRTEILKQIWVKDDYFTSKSMDVFLTRIRKLLKDDDSLEIENLYGSGYRIRLKTLSE